MDRARGLTLTEVVVIVLVCTAGSVGLYIFLRGGSLMRSGANEAQCRANLDALRKSMYGYASEHGGAYPFATHNPDTPASTSQNDALAWFAREYGLRGDMFVCPSTDDEPLLTRPGTPAEENDAYSYGYQAPYLQGGSKTTGVTENTLNSVVFLADKPPVNVGPVDWGALLAEDQTIEGFDGDDASLEKMMAGMSPNHGDGEVMMVASKASVLTVGRGDVGHNDDAVFMGGGPASPGTPAKTIADRQDSLLLRPDGQ